MRRKERKCRANGGLIRIDVELALKKIYGTRLSEEMAEPLADVKTRRREGAEIVDVEATKVGGQR
jgi:hypothetical protein